MTEAEVDSGGVGIHCEIEGTGPTLLLHTGGGGDLRMWHLAGYVEALADYRLVLMDHRGHGLSDRPREIEEHRIDRYVGDVIAVLDAAHVERTVFVGYSDGAAIGYAVAASNPDRVAGLVGIGAVGDESDSRMGRVEWAAEIRRDGIEALVRALDEEEGEGDAIPAWFVEQMRSTDPEMFALELEGCAAWPGPWSVFGHIEAPTMIIVGEHEEGPGGPAAHHAMQAAGRLRNGSYVALPGLGHVGAVLRSDLTVPHIRSFLAEMRPFL